MSSPALAVAKDTWRALLSPRRAVPIALLAVPMIVAQGTLSHSILAAPVALVLVVAFVGAGPAAFRALFGSTIAPPPSWPLLLRIAAFLALAACVVGLLGAALPRAVGLGTTFFGAPPSLAISVALFVVGGWGLARDVDLEASVGTERARADALARDAEDARVLAMQAHLDPHFLFNTLNAIAEWCREDGAVAERAILDLAEVLRTVTDGVRRTSWPLERELDLARAVLELHHVRDPSRFSLSITIDDATRPRLVPPLLLLPLVENAMTHGPAKGHRGAVDVAVTDDAGRTVVVIENPGAYAGPRDGGTGLGIVRRRLALAYPRPNAGGDDSYPSLSISGAGQSTRAVLRLPANAAGHAPRAARVG